MNKFEIENLELYYGDFKALKNINMNISPNEITAFIGPSGCGKSTLLKTLDRMNDLVDTCKINGSVKYDGKDIYSYDINELRKNVAMVFQKPNPFAMSIYDNVAYGPKTHGVRGKKELDDIVEKSLKQAALWDEVKDKKKKSAMALSGGQQQRLCIARQTHRAATAPWVPRCGHPCPAWHRPATASCPYCCGHRRGRRS